MSKNSNMHAAKSAKNDEFYTQLSDIEKELKHYKEFFKGKVVYCNCDDHKKSNFFQYFSLNFEYLGLKKLIATHFDANGIANKLEMSADITGDGKVTQLDIVETPLKQNGDFRSPESIELLKECDVVVTNPPFSLFREFIAQLEEYDKKFLVIGNMNAITYKEVFKMIKENKLWLGNNNNQSFVFDTPYKNLLESNAAFCKQKGYVGDTYVKVPAINWFTNIDYPKRHENLILYRNYNPDEYPKYDNYDAINVDKVTAIPCDYYGVMGVPITFLEKWNPEQFDIIWTTDRGGDGELDHLKLPHTRYDAPVVNNIGIYKRILIKRIQNED